ncbi:LVIVD repeat-containing protein [Microbacterium sp. NPDC056569]|uniref:LVIVD repeat-containing protein n=1 Tax=Microbacterium sp. NPDC056569 TaxID=3345867 RepID=UPI00366DDF4F
MTASAMTASAAADPRDDLSPGLADAGVAASGVQHLANVAKLSQFSVNSDLAFFDDTAVVGNYNGVQFYDISDPNAPVLKSSMVCPGSQNDVSVYGDLLFMSVEATSARVDCSTNPASTVFRGVRIFDISDIQNPVQVAAVQTCRGSHTHTLVDSPADDENVYVYVSGTAGVRSTAQMASCNNSTNPASENPSLWRIEVIKVPLAAPQDAAVVSEPRLFADPATGALNGLQNGPTQPTHPSGANYSPNPNTNACHDITVYPEIGLAAGACQGNGILIDISDPVNPVRLDAVADPNYSYWHSATFNNDGTTVVFTDEWGGGSGARCRATDRPEWGANSIYDIVDGKLEFRSYYKIPSVQTTTENCVAHNGSLVPVPGRDIMVQAWYQGGLSVFDFTDSANPVEIGYFDRGPISATSLVTGGYWSTYWYNGNILGSEIARGFDSHALTPTAFLSANEIAAASEVSSTLTNVQGQTKFTHAPSFAVVRSYVDQAERAGTLSAKAIGEVRKHVDQAETLAAGNAAGRAIVAQLDNAARKSGAATDSALVTAINALAGVQG